LKITKNAWDSNIIEANGKYLSVNWNSSGGGAFAIIPIDEVGKAPDTVPLFRGHKGPILDTAFNPFNKQQIVSCSDDGKIYLWEIPQDFSFHKYVDENDNIKDITEPIKVLSGHTRKVGHVQFHPCAQDIIASSSMDYSVKLWNLNTGEPLITLKHKDLVTCFAFNYNGSKLATTSRDKKLRIWDIRSGKVISEGPGHTGAKPSRVVWLGNTDRVLTTGFSRLSDRQVGIWDVNDIGKGPIDGFIYIDSSSGVLIPHFDESTSMLYLAGKGDGNIRYYEYENDILHEISQFSSVDPQRGFAVAPKNSVNIKENEVVKSFKTVNDSLIEPISFIVPRRSELFQEDIYPDAPSNKPAISAEDWFSGKDINGPLLVSMESIFEGGKEKLRESTPESNVSELKKEKEEQERKAREEAIKTKPKDPAESKRDESFAKESTPAKNVDEALKSSSEVNSLLEKVNDLSDDEDRAKEEAQEDEWEEVQKSESNVAISKPKFKTKTSTSIQKPDTEEVVSVKNNSVRKDITVNNPTESEKETNSEISVDFTPVKTESTSSLKSNEVPTKNVSPAPTLKALNKESEVAAPVETKTTNGASNAPTLKATVEKLAAIASQMEAQIVKLTEAAVEKDARLVALEKKIEQLLNK
jgi:coronin-1B/1C/6